MCIRDSAGQVSPSKRVNFSGTTPCFTCGSESGTSLCCANSSPPPASEHVPVRELAVLTPASFPPGLATAQLLSSNAWVLDSRIEDFYFVGHSLVGHTLVARANETSRHPRLLRSRSADWSRVSSFTFANKSFSDLTSWRLNASRRKP